MYFFLAASYRNLVLLFLTTIMEVVLVCFLLSTLKQLPYKLESKQLPTILLKCIIITSHL